jgi:hypothetical protein
VGQTALNAGKTYGFMFKNSQTKGVCTMTAQEIGTEALTIAGHLREHAETDPNLTNLRKVAEWAAGEIEKLAAALNNGA